MLGNGVTALGVIRVLSSSGIQAFVAEAPDTYVRRSRWFRAVPSVRPIRRTDDLAEWLDRVPIEHAVLMPCGDHWAGRVASLAPEEGERFPASSASFAVLQRLLDKGCFAETVRSYGTPHPFSRSICSDADLDGIPDALLANAMLKPVDSERFFRAHGIKAFHVHSRAHAHTVIEQASRDGQRFLLQEYVPGPADRHFFVDGFFDREHRLRAVFVRQRLRMFPPDFGNSTFMKSVEPDVARQAVDAVRDLLTALRFRGMFSAEFKRDARDDVFRILEVNARPWWYVEFAHHCGVDVCRMAYDDALGRPVEETRTYAVGRRASFLYFDYRAAKALWRAGELSLWAWARSWIGTFPTVMRVRDPMPFVGLVADIIGRALRRGLRGARAPIRRALGSSADRG